MRSFRRSGRREANWRTRSLCPLDWIAIRHRVTIDAISMQLAYPSVRADRQKMPRLEALAAVLAFAGASHVHVARVGNTPPWQPTWQVRARVWPVVGAPMHVPRACSALCRPTRPRSSCRATTAAFLTLSSRRNVSEACCAAVAQRSHCCTPPDARSRRGGL